MTSFNIDHTAHLLANVAFSWG